MSDFLRDPEGLIDALRDYSPDGVHVLSPLGGGTIRHQIYGRELDISKTLPVASFRVDLDDPIPFEEHAAKLRLSPEKMTEKELRKLWRGHEPPFPSEVLERGLSMMDIEEMSFRNMECLDDERRIVCYVFGWRDLVVDPLFPGAMVEYEEGRSGVASKGILPGRVAGGDKSIVFLELFEPMTASEANQLNTAPSAIQSGFYSKKTVAIGGNTWDAWTVSDPDSLPKGDRVEIGGGEYEVRLDEPLDLSKIAEFCSKHYPDEPACVWQSLLFFVLPLNANKGGRFHPLRAGQEGTYMDALEWEIGHGL